MSRLTLALLVLLALTLPAHATDYYIAPGGSDGNPCTQGSPCQSLGKGVSKLAAGNGDKLFLRQGTYAALDYQAMCPPNGTSYGNAATIASAPGETATLPQINLWPCGGNSELKYLILDRLLIDGQGNVQDTVAMGQGTHHIRFQNGEVKNAWSLGFSYIGIGENQFVEVLNTKIHDIHARGTGGGSEGGGFAFYIQSSDNLIDGCEMYNLDGYGIQFYNGYDFDRVDRNVVRNNKFYNTGWLRFFGGITVNHGIDNKIYNNIIYNTFGAIDIVRNARNTWVYNNTLYNNQAWGIRLDIGTSNGPNSIVRNNIIYLNDTSGGTVVNGVEVGSAPGYVVDHNLTSNPSFTNPSGGDFTLLAGSSARNAGLTIAAVPTDIVGVTRPQPAGGQYDIGAYEAVADGGGPPPGDNIYVDINSIGGACNNGNAGTSPGAPKCTLTAGINALSSGKTLVLRQGSYGDLDYQNVCLPSGSSYSTPTTVASYTNETATLSKLNLWPCGGNSEFKYVIFDRLVIDGQGSGTDPITMGQGTHHIRFQNGEVKNAIGIAFGLTGVGENQFIEVLHTKIHDIVLRPPGAPNRDGYGFYIQGSDTLIDGCEFYNLASYGVQMYNGYTFDSVDRNTIKNSTFKNTGFAAGFGGITVNHGTDNKIYNNIIADSYGAIDVVRNARNTLVANNTFYNNQAWGIRLDLGTSNGPNTTVKNNILYQSQTIEVGGAPGTNCSHNLSPGTPAGCSQNSTDNPQFNNANGGDFTLQAGSPARNAGTTVSQVTTDIAGTSRPQPAGGAYDIGAYEYLEGGGGPGPVSGNAIYLSVGGHSDVPTDAGDCTVPENRDTPRATMNAALACMQVPGKVLYIRGGTYTANIDTAGSFPITGGSAANNPTRIEGYGNESVVLLLPGGEAVGLFLRGISFVTVKNLTVDALGQAGTNAFACLDAGNLRIENSTFRNSYYEPGYFANCTDVVVTQTTFHTSQTFPVVSLEGTISNVTFDQVELHTGPQQGLRANVGSGSNTNLVVTRTQFHALGTGTGGPWHAFDLGPGSGALITNNILDHNNAGIRVRSGAGTVKVYNNALASNTGTALQCDPGAGPGVTITNNISFGNGTNAVVNNCGAVLAKNLDTGVDPLWTNVAARNFLPGPTSPAIDIGDPLAEVPIAIDGTPRPVGLIYDAGPYEQTKTVIPGDPSPPARQLISRYLGMMY